MDVAGFKAFFEEFEMTDAKVVLGALNEAARQIGPDMWGPFGVTSDPETKADDGQKWLAAHILSQTPFGQGTRMEPNKGKSVYWERYEELRDSLGLPSFMVAGCAF